MGQALETWNSICVPCPREFDYYYFTKINNNNNIIIVLSLMEVLQ